MKTGDLVKYHGTVGYGCGVGLVVDVVAGDVNTHVRVLAPCASKSGYIVQLQHNLEIVSD